MKLFKLSFSSKEDWDSIKPTIINVDEDGNFPSGSTYTANTIYGSATVIEIGHIPIPAVLDEEGVVVTEATYHEDFAVDMLLKEDIEAVTFSAGSYLVGEIEHPYHNFI